MTLIRGVTVLLEVFDMPLSLAFYRSLGFEVVEKWGEGEDESALDWVSLRLGSAELMLNTAYERDQRPAVPEAGRVKGHADTELYFYCDDVDAVREALRIKGVETPEPIDTFYGSKRLCLTDPDGFLVRFEAPGEGSA